MQRKSGKTWKALRYLGQPTRTVSRSQHCLINIIIPVLLHKRKLFSPYYYYFFYLSFDLFFLRIVQDIYSRLLPLANKPSFFVESPLKRPLDVWASEMVNNRLAFSSSESFFTSWSRAPLLKLSNYTVSRDKNIPMLSRSTRTLTQIDKLPDKAKVARRKIECNKFHGQLERLRNAAMVKVKHGAKVSKLNGRRTRERKGKEP